MEARTFYETGSTLDRLRRNLLSLCQPITGSAEIRENLLLSEKSSKKGKKEDIDQIIVISICLPGLYG